MRRTVRRAAIVLAALVLVAVAARLALEPLVASYARRALAGHPALRGTFDGVDVRVRELSCTLRGLRLERRGEGGTATVLEVPRVRFRFAGQALLRGRLLARVELEEPRLEARIRRQGAQPPPGTRREIQEAPRVGRRLAAAPAPITIERAEARRGEVRLLEVGDPPVPLLSLRDVEVTVEDLATSGGAGGASLVLAGRATLGRSGRVSVFATADPGADRATFAGTADLTGLRLAELAPVVARSGVEPDRGVLDLAVQFSAAGGEVSGAVRPTVHGGGTRAAESGLVSRIKSALADRSLDLFEEGATGTTVPLVGRLRDPRAHPLAAIVGVLRSAFVQGLTAAFRGPPPPEVRARAPERARRAVSPGRGRGEARRAE